MRARKLAAVAALSAGLILTGGSERPAEAAAARCEPTEIGAQSGTICRQYSLFGIRFSPKTVRMRVIVPKDIPDPAQFPGGTSVSIFWRNGDQYEHQPQTVSARDASGNLMGFRDSNGMMDCNGLIACADWTSALLPPRPALRRGERVRDEGSNSTRFLAPRPGTYTFRCLIHPSMTQTVVITQGAKFR
jgi:plastocyanin